MVAKKAVVMAARRVVRSAAWSGATKAAMSADVKVFPWAAQMAVLTAASTVDLLVELTAG